MADSRPRILLYGGAFDPFHNGHLQLARAVAGHYRLPAVRLLVKPATSQRKAQARLALYHRISMLQRLSRAHPFLELDLCEVLIDSKSTCASLRWMREHLQLRQPAFVLGSDQFMHLHRWRRAGELIPMALWAVAPRQGLDSEIPAQALQKQHEKIQSLGGRVDILDIAAATVSSTQVRAALRSGSAVDDLVPAPIAEYLSRHQLYRE